MKNYLREIELSGVLLVVIGIAFSLIWNYTVGVWPCAVGMLLWLVSFLYKAFHWKEYERDNRQNITILIVTIIMLLINFILIKR